MSSDYLSTTKPQVNTSTGSSGSSRGQTSKPSSKPSTGGNSGSSGGQTSKPSTGGNTSGGGSSSGGSSSGGLGDLANQVQQGRDDMGYSSGAGGQLTDSDADWVAGNVQLD